MITSKLTRKARTTIPQAVLTALDLSEGDEIAYHIEKRRVVLTKAVERPFAIFGEWAGNADTFAFRNL